jgi:acetyl esterase/lipase
MALAMTQPQLPGKLGDPSMLIKTDPRADPRMQAVMAPLGLDVAPPPAGVDVNTPIDELVAFALAAEGNFSALGPILLADAPAIDNVDHRTEVVTGVDGNEINLYIHIPKEVSGPMPCILHIHGGGMALMSATELGYVRWRDELAATGLIVVGVEFRNAGGKLGPHPFPAGLNDCAEGLRWVHKNRSELGISSIVISGESGGGNLSLATTLKAKQEGFIDYIDGVYAQCPYISGLYANKDPALRSLYENDDYFLNCSMMGALVRLYCPDRKDDTNPLAWPYHATVEDLRGLPPHVIAVNELDPLRDEGLVYYQKLLAAGVSTVSITVNGTCHAGDCLFRVAMPEVYLNTVRSIREFAWSL